jgi:rod shape-determining protein MreD
VIRYLLLPLLLLILVIVQITILDFFPLVWIGLEISLIVVIYCGFHLDALWGGILSLVLGFYMDCLTSAIFGLYTFLYTLIFYLSMIVAGNVYAEKPFLIGVFVATCTLLEGAAIVLLYRFFSGVDIFYAIPKIFIPKALALGFLSPVFFRLFNRFEEFLYAGDARQTKRV